MIIEPCGHRVLVRQEKLEEVDEVFAAAKRAGLHFQSTEAKREQDAVVIGFVQKIGPTAWRDFGGDAWCSVGDKVYFAKYAGKRVGAEEDSLVLLNDEDIVAVIKEA